MGKLVSVLLTYVIEELRFCQRDNNNNNTARPLTERTRVRMH